MDSIFFGVASDGREARLWRLSNAHGMTADITNMGACLVSLRVPRGRGSLVDVVLGLDGAAGYAKNPYFFGAVMGRCANRTGGASFELGGERFELGANEGANNNHSGPDFWPMRSWGVEAADERRIVLALESPSGDQGFPGAVTARTTYELLDDDALSITYEGVPSAATIMNLGSHAYFNLDGCASGSARDHLLQVRARSYTECDEGLIPTGRLLPVEGTPFDFREQRPLGPALDSTDPAVLRARGLDLNYAIDGYEPGADGFVGVPRLAATLVGPRGGIAMDVVTDTPGLQLYTANYIEGVRGKGGQTYHAHDAVCLETQFFPDAIHHPGFAQPVFGPDRPYRSRTVFSFRRA